MTEQPVPTNYIFNGKRLEAMEVNVKEARDAALQALGMLQADRVAHEVWRRDIWSPHQNADAANRARLDALEQASRNKWPAFLTALLAQVLAAGIVWLTVFRFVAGNGG